MSSRYHLNNSRRYKAVESYFEVQPTRLYRKNHLGRPSTSLRSFVKHQPKMSKLANRSFEETNKTIISEESYLDKLHDVVEELLTKKNPFVKRKCEELEKRLCKFWLLNGSCSYRNCKFYHSIQTAFDNEFKSFPSFKLLQVLVYVQEQKWFSNFSLMILETLKIRKRAMEWLAVLTTLIFLITVPEDERFFEFWIALVGEFCQLQPCDYSKNKPDSGFRKILEILSRFVSKDDLIWKLSNLIQVWEKAPFNLRLTYWVVQPVLKHHLPNTLLIKLVKSCNEFKIDTEKIYLEIIPKLSIVELSDDDRKILYSFCCTLLHCGFEDFSRLLEKRLESCRRRKNSQVELLKYRLNVRKDWEALAAFLRDSRNCVGDDIGEEIFQILSGGSFTKEKILIILEKVALTIDSIQAKSIIGSVVLQLLNTHTRKEDEDFFFSLVCICNRSDIEVPLNQSKSLSPAKLAFLIAEIYIEKDKCMEAYRFCEKHRLIHENPTRWLLKNNGDPSPQTEMLRKLFKKLESSPSALDILCKVLDVQNGIPKNVYKSLGNIINRSLNADHPQVCDIILRYNIARKLETNTIRSLIILLWRRNRRKDASRLLTQVIETIYSLPRFDKQPLTLVILSTWSTEELTLLFNIFFDKFAVYKFHRGTKSSSEFQVFIDMRVSSVPKTQSVPVIILNEIETSLHSLRNRVKNVLIEICPGFRLNFQHNVCSIDSESLANHLKDRREKLIQEKLSLY